MKNNVIILSLCALVAPVNAMHNASKAKCSLNQENQPRKTTTAVKALMRQIEKTVIQTIDQTHKPASEFTSQDKLLVRIILEKLAKTPELDEASRERIRKSMPLKKNTEQKAQQEKELKIKAEQDTFTLISDTAATAFVKVSPDDAKPEVVTTEAATSTTTATPVEQPKEAPVEVAAPAKVSNPERYILDPRGWFGW